MAGSVSVVLVRPLVLAIGSDRLEPFWRATDLGAALVADNDARISPAQFCVAWAEAQRLTDQATLALAIARATPPGAFGIIEYVCRAAPTLGDALRQWVRYLNLLDDAVEVALDVEDDRAYLRVVRDSEAPAPASHELCFALVAKYARELAAQPFRVTRVDFAHAAPEESATPRDPTAAYREWFDAPVAFGADTTQLVLPRAALALPLRTSDPALLAILTRAADDLARATERDPSTAANVARVLRDLLRDDAGSIEQVAKRLGVPPRSLQRRLKDEGTSFQVVRDATRKELAQRYLDARMSIAEISFLLGFSEPSAFFRAFKRWTGRTPAEARAT